MIRGPLASLVVLVFAACPAQRHGSSTATDKKPNEISIFLTTELRGQLEPCGCNSDPLGDVSKIAGLLGKARAQGPVLYLDGGSALFAENPVPGPMVPQESLKADLVAKLMPDELEAAALGLGPYDLSMGPERAKLARQAVNVAPAAGLSLEPPRVLDVGGVKVGVFGVVDPEVLTTPGMQASEPEAAAKKAIAELRAQGADVVVVLAQMRMARARKLARGAPGADFVLAGYDAPDPSLGKFPPLGAEKIGTAWLVQPANKGQIVSRLGVTVDRANKGDLVDAIGTGRAQARLSELAAEIAKREGELAQWKNDPTAEASFVKNKQDELAAMKAEQEALTKEPLRKPAQGGYFVFEQIPMKRGLPCDGAVQQAKAAYDVAAGEANLKAAAGEKPAPVPAGQAGYVGVEECSMCHEAAVTFWKKTHHANAWETLVKVNKQFDRSCIGCHVTGWMKPGGATIAVNEPLRDVQCETCHGPGSLHVDANGKEKPRSLVRKPEASYCVGACHTIEHSDTFQYEPYLRNVTGPGHGETLRKQLGDGPTGHELRAAALAKAGRGVGAGCSK